MLALFLSVVNAHRHLFVRALKIWDRAAKFFTPLLNLYGGVKTLQPESGSAHA